MSLMDYLSIFPKFISNLNFLYVKKRIILMSLFAMFLAVSSILGQGLTNSGYFYLPVPNVGGPYCHQPKGRGEQDPEEMEVCRLHKPQRYAFGPSRVTDN